MITTVLFDLDGTLLPMDQEVFVKAYFGGISKRLAARGFEPKKLVGSIWAGTAKMVMNDGRKTNEAVFWDTFAEIYGEGVREEEPYFNEFYVEDFDKVKDSCGYDPRAAEIISKVRAKGFAVALATNPIFPSIATEKRMAWAGLDRADFEHYTTYENSRYCKPNVKYYEEVCKTLGVCPCQCLMVGNDVNEDMVAQNIGMKVFLLTDCLINKSGVDISSFPHGGFDELSDFIDTL